jgi:hypothetical protein
MPSASRRFSPAEPDRHQLRHQNGQPAALGRDRPVGLRSSRSPPHNCDRLGFLLVQGGKVLLDCPPSKLQRRPVDVRRAGCSASGLRPQRARRRTPASLVWLASSLVTSSCSGAARTTFPGRLHPSGIPNPAIALTAPIVGVLRPRRSAERQARMTALGRSARAQNGTSRVWLRPQRFVATGTGASVREILRGPVDSCPDVRFRPAPLPGHHRRCARPGAQDGRTPGIRGSSRYRRRRWYPLAQRSYLPASTRQSALPRTYRRVPCRSSRPNRVAMQRLR